MPSMRIVYTTVCIEGILLPDCSTLCCSLGWLKGLASFYQEITMEIIIASMWICAGLVANSDRSSSGGRLCSALVAAVSTILFVM